MRETEQTAAFKKDLRREGKGLNVAVLNVALPEIINSLVNDVTLAAKYKDHKLTGEWEGYRSCHIRPDLILIYEKPDDKTLRLARMGSHSKIYGL